MVLVVVVVMPMVMAPMAALEAATRPDIYAWRLRHAMSRQTRPHHCVRKTNNGEQDAKDEQDMERRCHVVRASSEGNVLIRGQLLRIDQSSDRLTSSNNSSKQQSSDHAEQPVRPFPSSACVP